MQQVREVEFKLEAPPSFTVPEFGTVKGVASVTTGRRTLRARYFDTDDHRLAASGSSLRHRTGEGRPRWTLKLGSVTSDGLDRRELAVIGAGAAPPPELTDVLTARLRGKPLQLAVELRTRRTAWVLRDADGRELCEVVDDLVDATGPGGEPLRSWREVEVEHRPGSGTRGARTVERVVAGLTRAGAEPTSQTPKPSRALGLQVRTPEQVGPQDPAAQLVRWVLDLRTQQLQTHDAGVRLDLPDAVHQFRVTCRRLRSDLRTLQTLVPDVRAALLRDELSWLAGSFGRARDLEVLRDRLRRTATDDPGGPLEIEPVDALWAEQLTVALADGLQALGAPRYLALLELLEDLRDSVDLAPEAARPCATVLPPLAQAAWRRLRQRVERLEVAGPAADWHRARIAAKRARYAAETASIALGTKGMRTQAKRAERVQKRLGDHQDAMVAVQTLMELPRMCPDDAGLAFLCGQLVERERMNVVASRTQFLEDRQRLSPR